MGPRLIYIHLFDRELKMHSLLFYNRGSLSPDILFDLPD